MENPRTINSAFEILDSVWAWNDSGDDVYGSPEETDRIAQMSTDEAIEHIRKHLNDKEFVKTHSVHIGTDVEIERAAFRFNRSSRLVKAAAAKFFLYRAKSIRQLNDDERTCADVQRTCYDVERTNSGATA
jgi:hypothetical protein